MRTESGFHVAATVSLFLAIFCWSTMPLFLHSFIYEIDGWVANGIRYPFAALIWVVPLTVMLLRGSADARVFRAAIVPTIINLIGQTLWAWAPYFLEPAMQMFLARISIVFAIVVSFIVFQDERRLAKSVMFWGGIACCIAGFIGMNYYKEGLWTSTSLWGVVIIVAQSSVMACYMVSIRYCMRGIRPWVSFPVISIYTSVGLFIVMMVMGEPHKVLDLPFDRWMVLLASSFVGIALGHVLYYYSIENIGVSISSGCSLLMPFLTAIGSYWIYGERFTRNQWLFGILLLVGGGMLLREQGRIVKAHQPTAGCQIPELEEFSSGDDEGD